MERLGSASAREVTKRYGQTRALSGVSLTLRPGKLCALLGPNGAGKSTLVGIFSTLVRPTSGQVLYQDRDGRPLEPTRVRGRIGVLSHESFLYGELTAVENLAFYASLYDVPDGARRASELLDRVGLDPAARTRPARTYSRGMLQRLAVARALLHDPAFLLFDEPFTGLDRAGVEALGGVLDDARAEGRIVLVVTHDLEAVGGRCDHLVVVRRGKVVLDESRETPFSTAELKKAYLEADEAPVCQKVARSA